jgi:hypothetical protein
MKYAAALACMAMAWSGSPAAAQEFRIGVIDFYGLHKLSAEELRPQLAFAEDNVISFDDEKKWGEIIERTQRQLSGLAGVRSARVSTVCCVEGQVVIFVGIEEKGARHWRYRKPPKGAVRLPPEVVASGAEFDQALLPAVARGDTQEDHKDGHSISHAPELKRIQLQFVEYAQRYLPVLRTVLRESDDAEQRALAAQVIAYTSDKQAVVPDLVRAMHDPAEGVRNDATRALLLFTEKESLSGTPAIKVPYVPFVALLGSPIWTDRNKSSGALDSLTLTRDPKLLRLLRREAIAPLSEMARWKVSGYSDSSSRMLGRIAGYSEEEIASAIENGRQEELIGAAARSRKQAAAGSR